MVNDESIRAAVLSGIMAVPELQQISTPELIQEEVEYLVSGIKDRSEGADDAFLQQYSFNVARQRAQNLVRDHEDNRKPSRAEVRAIKQQKAEQEAAEYKERASSAKEELDKYLTELIENNKKLMTSVQLEALRYFRMVYVDDRRDPEINYMFPGTSRDQRYQWKTRAIRMVAPYVSESTKQYINERSRKQPKAGKLLQAATYFYNACVKGYHE